MKSIVPESFECVNLSRDLKMIVEERAIARGAPDPFDFQCALNFQGCIFFCVPP